MTAEGKLDNKRRERLFYTGMAAAFVITVFAGFSRTWFLRPMFHPEPLIPLIYVHGFIFTLWIALLLTQTTLIATKRTRTHMRLGVAGGLDVSPDHERLFSRPDIRSNDRSSG